MAEHEICEIMIRSVYKGDDGGHREPRSKQLASGEPSDLQQSISQLTIHHRMNRASYFHFRASLQFRAVDCATTALVPASLCSPLAR